MIRSVDDGDFAAIAAITNHYIASTAIHFAYEPVSDAALRDSWRAHEATHPWFVAETDGRVVGYAKAGIWRDRPAYARTTEIGLYLADDQRGKGIGTALYAALLDELPRKGFRSAIAGIALPNDASLALHRRFGFVSVGIVRDAGWKLERWHDVEFLQKRFVGSM